MIRKRYQKNILYLLCVLLLFASLFLPFAQRVEALPYDNAPHFDGNDDVLLANPYPHIPTNQFTVEFWVKTTSVNTAATMFSYETSTQPNTIIINNPANLRIHRGNVSVLTGISVNDGSWHHIAVKWRSSDGLLEVYKSGTLAFTATLQAGLTIPTGGAVALGQEQDGVAAGFDPTQAFEGQITDLRIWSTQRTQTEIQNNRSSLLAGSETGLVGWWKPEIFTTDKVYDKTANAKHMTGSGFSPSTGQNLTVTNVTETSASFKWSAVNGVTSYGLVENGVLVGNVADPSLSYTRTGRTKNTLYNYQMVLENSYGKSLLSASLPVRTLDTPDTALVFDGTNDYATVSDYPEINFGTGDFTLETWVKPNNYNPTYPMQIIKKKGTVLNQNLEIQLQTDGRVVVYAGEGTYYLFSTRKINVNEWHHIAVSRSGTTVSLYIDGLKEGSFSSGVDVSSAGKPVYIGWDTGNERFNGQLTDIRMWNIAKSAADIQNSMNRVLTGSETGLVGWWNPDVYSTKTFFQRSALGSNATVFGHTQEPIDISPKETAVDFSWTSKIPANHEIKRNGASVYSSSGGSYSDSGLTKDASYTYTYRAYTINGESVTSSQTIRTLKYPVNFLNFDGVDDYARAPDSPQGDGKSAMTIEFWMRTPLSEQYVLGDFSHFSGGVTDDAWLIKTKPDGKLTFRAIGASLEDIYTGTTSKNVADNQWHHVAIVFQQPNTRIYIDGLYDEKAIYNPLNSSINRSTSGLDFGGRYHTTLGGMADFFEGDLTDVRIWDKARTEAEIQGSMNASLTGSEMSLAALYTPDSLSTQKIYDRTSYANHVTNSNFTAKSIDTSNTTVGETSITLSWNEPLATKTSLSVSGSPLLTDSAATSYTQTSLSKDAVYSYQLTLKNSNGENVPVTKVIRTKRNPADSLLFDGVDDYIQIPYENSELDSMSQMTIEAWIKNPPGNTIHQRIVSNWLTGDQAYNLFLSASTSPVPYAPSFELRGTLGTKWVMSPQSIGTDDTWHHVAGVYTGNEMIIYVDGIEKTREPANLGNVNSSINKIAGIGKNKDGSAFPFKGNITEVRIWNTARTGAEIQGNMNASLMGSETGLVGYWKPIGFTTRKVYDLSSSKNNGVVSGNYAKTNLNITTSKRTAASLASVWDSRPQASSYDIYRNTALAGNALTAGYEDSGLQQDWKYTYEIVPKNIYGEHLTQTKELETYPNILSVNQTPMASSFPAVILNAKQQTVTADIAGSLEVSDFTGNGTGWNVSVQASVFKEPNGESLELQPNSLMLTAPISVTPIDGTTSANPAINAGDYVIDNGNQIKIISASAGSGSGAYRFTFPAQALKLTMNPSTTEVDEMNYAGSATPYESTITWTISNAP